MKKGVVPRRSWVIITLIVQAYDNLSSVDISVITLLRRLIETVRGIMMLRRDLIL